MGYGCWAGSPINQLLPFHFTSSIINSLSFSLQVKSKGKADVAKRIDLFNSRREVQLRQRGASAHNPQQRKKTNQLNSLLFIQSIHDWREGRVDCWLKKEKKKEERQEEPPQCSLPLRNSPPLNQFNQPKQEIVLISWIYWLRRNTFN